MAPSAPPRRFAPTPVETTTRSNHTSRQASREQEEETGAEAGETKPRRFAPQLWKDSSQESRAGNSDGKFRPQPVETIYRTNRKTPDAVEEKGDTQRVPRKFAPVVLDSAKRSRRVGDSTPAVAQHDKTESGHHLHAIEHRRHLRGDMTPIGEGEGDNSDAPFAALRRQVVPMDGNPDPRRLSMASIRSHSFKTPDLDTIESSESERTSQTSSSLSYSPGQGSPITGSDASLIDVYRHATRKRESVDETFQHYLLQLEAKKAHQRMEEQALAAFPNSDFHEPVQHYVDIEEEEEMEIEDRPVTWAGFEEDLLAAMAARRESTAKVSWEQEEMQRHAERLEQERNVAQTTARQPSQSPWWSDRTGLVPGEVTELKSMQDRARPPMLGSDIRFPRCPSPEPARFDVTQGSAVLRNQMNYLSESDDAGGRSDEEIGLWHASDGENEHVAAARSKTTSPSKCCPDKGLWGGFCFDDGELATPGGLAVPQGPTGLMTPAVEHSTNPFELSFTVPGVVVSPEIGITTPDTPTKAMMLMRSGDPARIDSILNAEKELDRLMESEYPDSFVTQVYNYLSLGYPSLARPFDEELSKISHVPIVQLREDDKTAKASPKGYIRLGPDFEGGGGNGMTAQKCNRWRALKLYIREWARQEKDMVQVDDSGGNWGTSARRGSWAF
ncbi:hypothetical protein LTR08_000601 [Meristemomyces frigidus]|nr:hypothetical protein LTR08_000601 [Meristemomyces frigidus]